MVRNHSTKPRQDRVECLKPIENIYEARLFGSQREYGNQFSHIYHCRLRALLSKLRVSASKKWSMRDSSVCEKIIDLQPGHEAIIFGVIYAQLEKKPNVLHALDGDLSLPPIQLPSSYLGGEQKYFLEDESGRVELTLNDFLLANPDFVMITGLCIGILGVEANDGKFSVIDYCLPGMAPKHEMTLQKDNYKLEQNGKILLVSGLGLGSLSMEEDCAQDLLLEYIKGNLMVGDAEKIIGVFIVGNLFGVNENKPEQQAKKRHGGGGEDGQTDSNFLLKADRRLAEIAQSSVVVVIPGENDPSNLSLPQAPLKRCLFSTCQDFESLTMLSNPALMSTGGISMILGSGQVLDDLARYAPAGYDRVDLARLLLRSRHLAPSAPDTLWCYPYHGEDPLVLESSPDLFIVGGQPNYSHCKIIEDGVETTVVLVPSFSTSRTAVLLDIASFECTLIKFD